MRLGGHPDARRRRAAALALVVSTGLVAACRARGGEAERSLNELERRGPPYAEAELDAVVATLSPTAPPVAPRAELGRALVARVGAKRGFDDAEAVAAAWRLAPRASRQRERAWGESRVRFSDDESQPIVASVYSLPANVVSEAEARRFLAECRRSSPGRVRLVLTELPLESLAAEDPNLRLLPTFQLALSPWPRDPFLFARRADGGVELVLRPNAQPTREADPFLARALIQQLPEPLDDAWGRPTWSVAPIPFHAGQWLTTSREVWLSLHTLEPHILGRLGLESVPVETFGEVANVERYLAQANVAATALGGVLGRSTRFVHDLPDTGTISQRLSSLRALGGGAGFDLDSLLTLPPPARGRRGALVASVAGGAGQLAAASDEELVTLAAALELAELSSPAVLRSRLTKTQHGARAQELEAFLDSLATHLERAGLEIRRLPLVLVPTGLLSDAASFPLPEFLLSWNNVVFDRVDGGCRAEGFSGFLAGGDRLAQKTFAEAGCPLGLLPPLRASVVGAGGYRCASNHLRADDGSKARFH